MQTALVTGGCGLIGQHICSGLIKKGYDVIAVDTDEQQHYNTGKLHYSFIQCAPTNKEKIEEIFENNKIDILIHAACTVDNDLGYLVTETEISDSAACDKFIYRFAMQNKAEKIILLSTDQIYDFPKTREPIQEDNDLKPTTNYAMLKYASEKALVTERHYHSENSSDEEFQTMCCIIRVAPVYTKNFTENLISKIKDPKDGTLFVYGAGQYGFQLCCVHNLVDFILCFVQNADNMSYEGIYNMGDKELTKASDIIAFMREHYHLGTVIQKSPGGAFSKLKGIFSGANKEEKTNYRYLDLQKIENNNMLDKTKAAKFATFRWNIHNTK